MIRSSLQALRLLRRSRRRARHNTHGVGADTAEETAEYLAKQGEKVGVIKVHLFRPFSVEHFIKAIPATAKSIAVLDRTKESGNKKLEMSWGFAS